MKTQFDKLFNKNEKQYLSPLDIVSDMVNFMDKKNMIRWANAGDSELAMSHLGTGMNIRNHYKMWHENNPYFKLEDAIVKDGVIIDPLFPDNACSVIMRMISLECKARLNSMYNSSDKSEN